MTRPSEKEFESHFCVIQTVSAFDEVSFLEERYKGHLMINPALNRKLVSFQANKKVPFYGLFKYKEGFSAQMVKTFVSSHHKKSGLVLDPFSGIGTTLFAARDKRYRSLGIEILPIGVFILKSRLSIERVPVEKLKKEIEKLKKIDFEKITSTGQFDFKHVPITEKAFSPANERALNGFREYIDTEISDEDIKIIFNFAGFSILEAISYTRKDGQYLRWDHRSGKGRTKFDKGKIYSFNDALFQQLQAIYNDKQSFTEPFPLEINPEIITGTCLTELPKLKTGSVDVVITSPPYCNRYDYTRTYALELVYLGCDEKEIKSLRQSLLTCTVENREKLELLQKVYREHLFNEINSAFQNQAALQEILHFLETQKNEGKLNNPGIYSMVKNYFFEMSFVIFELARLLNAGGEVFFVNDNVRYAGCTIPVDLILCDIAKKAGLDVDKIWVLENGKGNSSQQMGTHGRIELRKCVYHWIKR
jgi:DNA modification methylase